MWTRHLIEVKNKWQLKVAQYWQWDWYPTWQWKSIVEFLQEADLNKFKEKLDRISFLTIEEIEDLNGKIERKEIKFPLEHHRDTWSEILKMILDGNIEKLVDRSYFKNDTLFCEYYYMLDFDNDILYVNWMETIKISDPNYEKFLSYFAE